MYFRYVINTAILVLIDFALKARGKSAIISKLVEQSQSYAFNPRRQEFLTQLTENDILDSPQENIYRARFLPMKIWEKGVVPIIIDEEIAKNQAKVDTLTQAMKVFAKHTCIRFKTRTNEKDYIRIVDGGDRRCYSFVGRVGDEQILSIGSGCEVQVGIVVHEMNHALGMLHEHSRPDRDQFITVDHSAIKDGYDRNFEKYSNEVADTLDLPYDYGSLMHYHAYAFTKDGRMTIIPKDFNAKDVMGQREGFSACDIAKLNTLYQCDLPDSPKCEGAESKQLTTSVSQTSPEASEKTSSTAEITTVPSIFPPQKPEERSCDDVHSDCYRIAENPELCTREPGIYMLKCKKSCHNCDGSVCIDGQGFPASKICGYYTPRHCGYANVDTWCPASCGKC